MHPFIKFLIFLGFGLFGYLIGSINNAVIISNLFLNVMSEIMAVRMRAGQILVVFGRKAGITVWCLIF